MSKKQSKHDLFFAKGMEDIEKARALFKSYFPKEIQEYVDLDTAKLEHLNSKFVDDKLSSYTMCDALYEATSKDGTVLLLCHAEHLSYDEEMIALRANHYATSALFEYRKKHSDKPLPPILSIIYFQGKKPFTHSLDPRDLFKNIPDAIKQFIFKPILVDLTQHTDEELKKHGASAAFELIMKHIFDKSTRENIEKMASAYDQTDGLFRESALRYIISSSGFDTELFNEVFSPYIDIEKLMTIEQQLKKEGRKEATEQFARESLVEGVDANTVAKIFHLDLETVKKIKESIH
jgi:predicted transposase YdaD